MRRTAPRHFPSIVLFAFLAFAQGQAPAASLTTPKSVYEAGEPITFIAGGVAFDPANELRDPNYMIAVIPAALLESYRLGPDEWGGFTRDQILDQGGLYLTGANPVRTTASIGPGEWAALLVEVGPAGDSTVVADVTFTVGPSTRPFQPPPWLGFDASTFPRRPVPGAPLIITFRVENRGNIAAAAVVVDIDVGDPGLGVPPPDIEPTTDLCEARADGSFRCSLGDVDPGAMADLAFRASTPRRGALVWSARMESAGDLAGIVEHYGMFGGFVPAVEDVVVIDGGEPSVADGAPGYPYPYGPRSRGSQSRYLLLVGFNLPRSGQDVTLTDTNTINYNFLAYPDTTNAFYREWFDKGWSRYYETDDVAAARARAEEAGLDSLLVRADLLEGVMPGNHTVELGDSQAHWGLEFGDISAHISFVRQLPDGGLLDLRSAYFPEVIRLAVETNMRLPLEAIQLRVNAADLGGGNAGETALVATRADDPSGTLYLTEPISLYAAGTSPALPVGLPLAVRQRADEPGLLRARLDDSFMYSTFRVPVDPLVATVAVRRAPVDGEYNWSWRGALVRAAICHDGLAGRSFAELEAAESEEIWNVVWIDAVASQSVRFGHHAAAILLRDTFVHDMQRQRLQLEWVRGNDQALRGLLRHMKSLAFEDRVALNRMPVTDFDGGETEYRWVIANDVSWLAEYFATDEAAIEAWQLRETRAAIDRMIEAGDEAVEMARDAGDCEIDDLVRLTGFGFDSINETLKAELVVLPDAAEGGGSPGPLIWRPDVGAIDWVDRLAPLATAVREQQRQAEVFRNLSLSVAGMATLPLALAESTGVALVAFALDAANLGLTTIYEVSAYLASESELEFALGAAVLIGTERHDDAVRNAKGWASTAFGIGTAAFGAAGSGLDVLSRSGVLRRIARGRHVARNLETAAAIDDLAAVDARDLAAFAVSARARTEANAAETLTAIEQKAVTLVSDYGDGSATAASAFRREATLPPSDLYDPFTSSALARYAPDNSYSASTIASARRPIARARVSGDVPNAADARVPENYALTVQAHPSRVDFETPGGPTSIPLGEYIHAGSTSTVYAHADDPTGRVVRITFVADDSYPALLDAFGRGALDELDSPFIRAAREYGDPLQVVNGNFPRLDDRVFVQGEVGHVMVVERVDVLERGAALTDAQRAVLNEALHALNDAGLVWLDNKFNNFNFVTLEDGSLQVVVVDTGGIVPVRADMDLPRANLARTIQLLINGDFVEHFPEISWARADFRTGLRRGYVRDSFGDAFDYDALGIPGIDALHFNPRSGEDYPVLGQMFSVWR